MNQQVPYNTGKVKIGSMYKPRQRNYVSQDGEFLQRVYLTNTKPLSGRTVVVAAGAAVGLALIAMVML